MAKEKATVKAEDTTVEKESPDTDETEETKSIAEEAEIKDEETEEEEETAEPLAEETEETEEEKPKETKEKPSAAEEEETAEEETEGDELSDLLEGEPVKKTGTQKRIDKLTAQNKALQERLDRVERDKTEKETGERVYTKQELRAAEKKAFEDQDWALLSDIQEYREERIKKELRKEYLNEQKKIKEAAGKQAKEWASIVNSYNYLADPDEPELYEGSRNDLNLKNHSSLLYRLALALYTSPDDEELRKYYQEQAGGQRIATADALAMILQKKRGLKPKDKEKIKLKKKLAKERRKKSLGKGGAGEEETETPKRPPTDSERLKDYITSRKKRHQAAIGSLGMSETKR